MNDFLKENFAAAKKYKDIWLYLSHQDLNSQFRHSRLGIVWMVINQLSFSIGAGLIWAAVFGLDPIEFIPFISTGFAVWGFITASFVESCSTFHLSQGFIKQVKLPLAIYVIRMTYASIIRFLIGISVALIVVLCFGRLSLTGFLFFIPGLLLVIVFGFLTATVFSYLGSRYRDVQHGLTNLFQILFVLTPVIYPPKILIEKGLGFAVYINPLTSIIEIIRKPLVEQIPASALEYSLVVLYIITLLIAASYLNRKMEKTVVYYL